MLLSGVQPVTKLRKQGGHKGFGNMKIELTLKSFSHYSLATANILKHNILHIGKIQFFLQIIFFQVLCKSLSSTIPLVFDYVVAFLYRPVGKSRL